MGLLSEVQLLPAPQHGLAQLHPWTSVHGPLAAELCLAEPLPPVLPDQRPPLQVVQPRPPLAGC